MTEVTIARLQLELFSVRLYFTGVTYRIKRLTNDPNVVEYTEDRMFNHLDEAYPVFAAMVQEALAVETRMFRNSQGDLDAIEQRVEQDWDEENDRQIEIAELTERLMTQ